MLGRVRGRLITDNYQDVINEKEGGEAGKGLADVASQALDLIPEKGGKPAAGKGLGSKIKGAFKGMSSLAKGTAGLSVAVGAYDAYSNYKEAVLLRTWDDLAKDPTMQTEPIESFASYITASLKS
jgi:hypothetical protein